MTSSMLKRILFLDAASCLGMGVLLAATATPLAAPLGIDAAILRGAGLLLLPVALFILWVGTRKVLHAPLVWAVVAGNLLWIVESALLAANAPAITILGQAFVAAQAAMVAGLSALEAAGALGLRAARA